MIFLLEVVGGIILGWIVLRCGIEVLQELGDKLGG